MLEKATYCGPFVEQINDLLNSKYRLGAFSHIYTCNFKCVKYAISAMTANKA